MSAGEYCNREVVVVEKHESVHDAARLMREFHVGDVIVIEQRGPFIAPVGILTDRDIVVELLAQDVDLDEVTIADVMSDELVMVPEQTSLMDAIKLMRQHGVRRLVVTNENDALAGLLCADDILELITEQLSDLTVLIGNEIDRETRIRK